ncbi:hypothetical protein GGQ80_002251 [Sphingomonas jinjuensis]|uniref:Calcineurin-like phosphoesterase domain-containing protein n=1 Tax=Sphingomonas jinjuensis TaxID=535907 RepID=A0A840FK61_9SPHN|nr:hypothetical protein [Sphingomonas jinjuensis]
MSAALCWVHVGDLHLEAADGWQSLDRLRAIVAEVNAHVGASADFVFLPGDNANHGEPEQYARMIDTLRPLTRPWRIIPGDHDFEPGDLDAYEAAVPEANRPETEVIGGYRCLYLDVVSAGAGGPDFRLTQHDRRRIAEELARAEAAGQVPAVFMHAYPGDLTADVDEIASGFAQGGVAFVDTGHTHYNELLNDGRVLYGATRSTGQIEEDGGRPGYAIVCLHGRVASWRFRRIGEAWPHVQIVAPSDIRLVTRPADAAQVPRPDAVTILATVMGSDDVPMLAVDGRGIGPMVRDAEGLWRRAVSAIEAGVHRVEVTCAGQRDAIDVLVRGADAIPKRWPPVAPGRECHAIGAWLEAGIEGTQLGPNKNGCGW